MDATWYFDFVSPFAYLQWRRLQRLPLAGLHYRPVLFAGLLDRIGHKGPAEIAAKRVFTYRQVVWRAGRDGIPLRFPPAHPFNPLPALRLCVAAGTTVEAIDTVFRHIWEEGNAVQEPGGIEALARRLGLPDAARALADDGVKSALQENFTQALEHQVFGVPTIACDGLLFWGDDATDMFLDYLRDPAAFRSGQMLRVARLPVAATRPRAR
jgi:2-hydroxychromene-2-carboxylate isomerase